MLKNKLGAFLQKKRGQSTYKTKPGKTKKREVFPDDLNEFDAADIPLDLK